MTPTVSNLSVSLGRTGILSDVSITAAHGKITAIVGPNGSGKTTLLRAITGDVAYDGKILLGGRDIQSLLPWQLAAECAVLPQATALAFPFTVVEVVRLGLHCSTAREDDQIALSALAQVGLNGYKDRFYQELSGGEQQRVQLARVLSQVWEPVCQGVPRWLLLDEPVSSLDIGHQLEVMEIMRRFAEQGGGIITVMHDLNLTAIYADQIAVMSSGRILASGEPAAVLTNSILSQAYGCSIQTKTMPENGTPFILPTRSIAIGAGP